MPGKNCFGSIGLNMFSISTIEPLAWPPHEVAAANVGNRPGAYQRIDKPDQGLAPIFAGAEFLALAGEIALGNSLETISLAGELRTTLCQRIAVVSDFADQRLRTLAGGFKVERGVADGHAAAVAPSPVLNYKALVTGGRYLQPEAGDLVIPKDCSVRTLVGSRFAHARRRQSDPHGRTSFEASG